MCVFLVTRPFTWYNNLTLTLKFDLLLKNFNLGCFLVMVATGGASLSSDNSYCLILHDGEDIYIDSLVFKSCIFYVTVILQDNGCEYMYCIQL